MPADGESSSEEAAARPEEKREREAAPAAQPVSKLTMQRQETVNALRKRLGAGATT